MTGGGLVLWQQSATGGNPQSAVFESLLWFGALVLALSVGMVVGLWARKRYRGVLPESPLGLSLEDLRRQRDRGLLTPQEYESLRQTITRSYQADDRRSGPS